MAQAKRKDCGTDHRDFTEDFCPECGEEVDAYGNIGDQIEYCTYPDCWCAYPYEAARTAATNVTTNPGAKRNG